MACFSHLVNEGNKNWPKPHYCFLKRNSSRSKWNRKKYTQFLSSPREDQLIPYYYNIRSPRFDIHPCRLVSSLMLWKTVTWLKKSRSECRRRNLNVCRAVLLFSLNPLRKKIKFNLFIFLKTVFSWLSWISLFSCCKYCVSFSSHCSPTKSCVTTVTTGAKEISCRVDYRKKFVRECHFTSFINFPVT